MLLIRDIVEIMENKMETAIVYCGCMGGNGKEKGNYYSIAGSYWDNGKENGN